MKRFLYLLLLASIATNVWLWQLRGHRSATSAAAASAASGALTTSAPESPPPAVWSWAAVDSTEPLALRDAMLAAGASERDTRAVLEGVLRRRHREKLAAARIVRTRTAWWRDGRSAQAPDGKLFADMVDAPLRQLLGRHPLDLADAESRYGFLSADKRRLLAQIDLDYAELLSRVPRTVMNIDTPVEAGEQRLLADARRADALAALTREERAEYDLRFSGAVGVVVRRMDVMAGSEAEFRAVKPVIDEFEEKSKALPKDGDFVAAYEELKREAAEKLVRALGRRRAMDYVWSGGNDFASIRRAADAAQLPLDAASRAMELAVLTGEKAAAVHRDASLTLEQKRAALLELQQTARAHLDVILPAEVQQSLGAKELQWLEGLSAGRYSTFAPSLTSSNGVALGSIDAQRAAPAKRSPLIVLESPAP